MTLPQTWKKLRGLMSRMDKNSLTKRIENFQMNDLTPEAAFIARGFVEDMTFQKVQSVSNVAATFFAWVCSKYKFWSHSHIIVLEFSGQVRFEHLREKRFHANRSFRFTKAVNGWSQVRTL